MSNVVKMMTINDSAELQLAKFQFFDVIGAAANQQEAIELLAELQPDLVTMEVSDFEYENKSFAALCCIDKILEKKPDTKILVLCSAKNQRIGIKALMRGAHSFLQKPFNHEQLSRALKTTSTQLLL